MQSDSSKMNHGDDILSRCVSASEVASYKKYGVVKLSGILNKDWLERAVRVYEEVMDSSDEALDSSDAGARAREVASAGGGLLTPNTENATGRFVIRTWNWNMVPMLADLGTGSPFSEIAASLMSANRINFFGDQLFLKEPGSMHRTAFHQDASYFNIEGDQCLTIWIPLDVVDLENGAMGYVRGSHRWPIHAANMFISQDAYPGGAREPLPDIEGNESEFDIEYYDVKPGDVIIHHVRTAHGSTGNLSADRGRRAIAFRYCGDDIRYLERPGVPENSPKSDSLKNGDVIDSAEFPLIWTKEAGYCS